MNKQEKARAQKLNESIERQRKIVFPNMTLCHVQFSNGRDTNEFIPDEVANDPVEAIRWWNENAKDDYIPSVRDTLIAVKVEPIKTH